MKKALYISYFGIHEPLVQTQVLPYLRELLKDGHAITLLTFEPVAPDKAAIDAGKDACGLIEWHWLPYHKWPSAIATTWDVFRGAVFIWRRIAEFHILHCRVHVPMLMGVLARKFSSKKPKLLFDIRGFFPEEYVDAGVWKKDGLLFRTAKRIERWLLKEADGFVVLTEKAQAILFGAKESGSRGIEETRNPKSPITDPKSETRPVEVIPCCVDLERRFSGDQVSLRENVRNRLGISQRNVILHLGALGGLYLTTEIADVISVARKVNSTTFALFLTQSDRALIEPLLVVRGFGIDDYWIGQVLPDDIEGYLCASDVGLSFVKSSYATQSRSPTKI